MPDPIEELKNRILDLENDKKALADILQWRQNEHPKIGGEIAAINKALHDLRAELAELKKPAPAAVAPAGTAESADPFHGFFS